MDSAVCRADEVKHFPKLVEKVRVYQVGYSVFPYQWYLDFWHQMTFKVRLMSLNFERYKIPSRMTKFSSLQENNIKNILILKSISASLIM